MTSDATIRDSSVTNSCCESSIEILPDVVKTRYTRWSWFLTLVQIPEDDALLESPSSLHNNVRTVEFPRILCLSSTTNMSLAKKNVSKLHIVLGNAYGFLLDQARMFVCYFRIISYEPGFFALPLAMPTAQTT